MIIVRVELASAVTGQVTELARMSIDNLGTTTNTNFGDYRTRTFRGRSADALHRAMLSGTKGVQRESIVIGHPRLREHVWNLVAKGLAGMGYGRAGTVEHIDAPATDDDTLQAMAERFCATPLPWTVASDTSALVPGVSGRTGANLLTVAETKAMLAEVLEVAA